jgi:hypothetical protein
LKLLSVINVTKQDNYSYKDSNKCHLWNHFIFAILGGVAGLGMMRASQLPERHYQLKRLVRPCNSRRTHYLT